MKVKEEVILEGRWKLVEKIRKNKSTYYVLENIYNHEKMELKEQLYQRVIDGKTTISNIRAIRTYKSRKWDGDTINISYEPHQYPPKAALRQAKVIKISKAKDEN